MAAAASDIDGTAAQRAADGGHDSMFSTSYPTVVVDPNTTPSADPVEPSVPGTITLPRNPSSHPNSGDESDVTPRSEVPSESPAVYQSFPQLQQQQAGAEPGYFSPRPLRYHQATLASAAPASTEPSPVQATSMAGPPPDPTTAPTVDGESGMDPLHLVDRPVLHRDHTSSGSTTSSSTVRASTADHILHSQSLRRQPLNELPPILSPTSVGLTHYHPPPSAPHILRSRSSHPSQHTSYSASHVATLSQPFESESPRPDILSRTEGNTPASSPGLFTPRTPSARPTDDNGYYSSPYLHFTQRHAPKETHRADVDVDPVSGRKIINQYEVIDELGRGVHGKVKLGRNLLTNQYVAIKIVERFSKRPRLGKNTSHEDKIRREIAILKKARHPNIVSLLEVIDDPTRKKVYIVLEHVEMGEVRWRTDAPKEVSIVEYRRYQRSRYGVKDSDEHSHGDERIMHIGRRRRRRRERQRKRELQGIKLAGSEGESWSLEHGIGSEDDLSDALSRVSSTLSHDPLDQNNSLETAFRDNGRVGSANALQQLGDRSGADGSASGSLPSRISDHDLANKRKTSVASSISTLQSEYEDVPENFRYVPLMSLHAARAAIRDTVLGLEYLHYQGVIHRDIKPANLLQTKDHHIKISDFGVSYLGRPSSGSQNDDQSESDAPGADDAIELAKTVGTPAFYAPELCQTDEEVEPPPVTNAIDVWAVGVTLYCLVFGRVPFHHTGTFGMMRMIAEEEVHIPRLRLKAVDERENSRHQSHSRVYSPPNAGDRRSPGELVYEEVDEDLYDLLRRLLIKDPRQRITLREVKEHPWLLRDITNKAAWVDETAPERQTGQRVHITREEVDDAVTSIDVMEKLRSGLRKITNVFKGGSSSSTRKRAKSNATGSEHATGSNASSSSTISQDGKREGRRGSLRVDDALFAALRHSREREERRLPHSVAATPDVRDRSHYFLGPNSRPHSPIDAIDHAVRQQQQQHQLYRPHLPERAMSTMSTAASAKTIRPSDLQPIDSVAAAREPSMHPVNIPVTPVETEHPIGSGLSSLFSGVNRLAMGRRDRSTSVKSGDSRARSSDRLKASSDDPHCEPSIAISSAQAAGQVDQPPLPAKSEPHQFSEGFEPPRKFSHPLDPSQLRPHGYVPSRQSSISSSSSHRHSLYSVHEERPPPLGPDELAFLHQMTSEDRIKKMRDENIRRRFLEEQRRSQPIQISHSRSISTQSQPLLPTSPPDEAYAAAVRRNSAMLDREHLPTRESSLDTSPMTQPSNPHLLNSSSSEDHFREDISQSTSYPSIPSVTSGDMALNKMSAAPQYGSFTEEPKPQVQDLPTTVNNGEDYDESADDENDGLTMAGPKKSVTRARTNSNANPSRRRTRRSRHGGSSGGIEKVPSNTTNEPDTPERQVLASSESTIVP